MKCNLKDVEGLVINFGIVCLFVCSFVCLLVERRKLKRHLLTSNRTRMAIQDPTKDRNTFKQVQNRENRKRKDILNLKTIHVKMIIHIKMKVKNAGTISLKKIFRLLGSKNKRKRESL